MSQRNPQIKNCNRVASSEGSRPPVSPRLPLHTPVLIWNLVTSLQYLLGPVWPVASPQIYSVTQVQEMPSQGVTFHPGDAGKLFTNHAQHPTPRYPHTRLLYSAYATSLCWGVHCIKAKQVDTIDVHVSASSGRRCTLCS